MHKSMSEPTEEKETNISCWSTQQGRTQQLSALSIVLLGGRWTGKSSSGNTILRGEEFDTETRTAQCVRREGGVGGRKVTVVDTPGWWRRRPVKDTSELDKREIVHSVSLCPPGPCAFLLVIRVDKSFPETQRRSEEEHLELLSDRVWRHTIVLFTKGDGLGDRTVEEHIEAEGDALRWVLDKCGNRYHVLNNRNRSDVTQVTELLEKVEEVLMRSRGGHFEIPGTDAQNVKRKMKEGKDKARKRMMKVEQEKRTFRALPKDQLQCPEELQLVLLGGRRQGKSSSGNTILHREEFETGKRTSQCQRKCGEVAGKKVIVVDTPGIWKNNSVLDTPELDKQEIRHSVSLCTPAPCAFLLVVSVDRSFTGKHRRSVQEHLELLSETVWRQTIVLFTCGDWLGNRAVEEHIEAEGDALRWVVAKCGNRYHVLNNKNRTDLTQVRELLEKVEEMVAKNKGHFIAEDKMESVDELDIVDTWTFVEKDDAIEATAAVVQDEEEADTDQSRHPARKRKRSKEFECPSMSRGTPAPSESGSSVCEHELDNQASSSKVLCWMGKNRPDFTVFSTCEATNSKTIHEKIDLKEEEDDIVL